MNLYTVGYAEGALFSLWLSKCYDSGSEKCEDLSDIQLDSFYNLKKSAGLAGTYDLSYVQMMYLIEDVGLNLDDNKYGILDQF